MSRKGKGSEANSARQQTRPKFPRVARQADGDGGWAGALTSVDSYMAPAAVGQFPDVLQPFHEQVLVRPYLEPHSLAQPSRQLFLQPSILTEPRILVLDEGVESAVQDGSGRISVLRRQLSEQCE